MREAQGLDELEGLVAKHGTGVVVLSRVLAICDAFDIPCRLVVSLESCSRERWVEVAGCAADVTIGVREANQEVCWLGAPERIGEDTIAWPLTERDARPVSWLDISNATHSVRIRLADVAVSLISAHGWRDAVDDLVAEPVLWVADLLEGIAQLVAGPTIPPNSDTRSPHDRQLRARAALDLVQAALRSL